MDIRTRAFEVAARRGEQTAALGYLPWLAAELLSYDPDREDWDGIRRRSTS